MTNSYMFNLYKYYEYTNYTNISIYVQHIQVKYYMIQNNLLYASKY